MTSVFYGGETIPVPETTDPSELVRVILDTYAAGTYSFLWLDDGTQPPAVQLMIGPGIPIAIIDEQDEAPTAPKA